MSMGIIQSLGANGMSEIPTKTAVYYSLIIALEKLTAPTIAISGDTLQITNNDNRATSIGIYVDGVLATTIPIGG